MITSMHFAREVMPSAHPDYLLGAALPEFIHLYRNKTHQVILPSTFNGMQDVKAGMELSVAIHHSHLNPFRSELITLLAEDLRTVRTLDDARRAEGVARAGSDLLLDGIIASWGENEEQQISSGVIEEVTEAFRWKQTALAAPDVPAPTFVDSIRQYFREEHWRKYHSATQVARILHLRGKSEKNVDLEFSAADIPYVADHLERQKERLMEYGAGLIQITLSNLQAEKFVLISEGML